MHKHAKEKENSQLVVLTACNVLRSQNCKKQQNSNRRLEESVHKVDKLTHSYSKKKTQRKL